MSFPMRFSTRQRGRRGQSMVEYTLVIAGIALVALFTGYQALANIIVGTLDSVVGFL